VADGIARQVQETSVAGDVEGVVLGFLALIHL